MFYEKQKIKLTTSDSSYDIDLSIGKSRCDHRRTSDALRSDGGQIETAESFSVHVEFNERREKLSSSPENIL